VGSRTATAAARLGGDTGLPGGGVVGLGGGMNRCRGKGGAGEGGRVDWKWMDGHLDSPAAAAAAAAADNGRHAKLATETSHETGTKRDRAGEANI
jgi:hypothetical protein